MTTQSSSSQDVPLNPRHAVQEQESLYRLRSESEVRIYSWAVALVAWGLLLPLLYVAPLPPLPLLGLLGLLAIVSEALIVPLPRGGYQSVGLVVASAALMLMGPVYAALVMSVGVTLGNGVVHRRPVLTTVFNSGVYIFSPLFAGVVFMALRPAAGFVRPLFTGQVDPPFLLSLLAGVLVYIIVSSVLVSARIAMRRHLPLVAVATTNLVWELVISLVLASVGVVLTLVEKGALPSVGIVLATPLLLAAYILMLHTTREHAHGELQVVERIGRALMIRDPQKLFQTMYDQIRQIMSADAVYVALYDAQRDLLAAEFLVDAAGSITRQRGEVSPAMRQVLTTRTPIFRNPLAEDTVREDPLGRDGEMRRPGAAFMCVPIAKGDQVLGLLSVQNDSVIGFTQRDLQLLQAIATQAATAIENAHLYDEARRGRDELSVLYEAAKTMSSSLELQAVLDNLVQVTCRAFEYEYGAILLVDEPSNDLVVHAIHGYDASVRGYRVPAGKGVTGWVQSTGTPAIVPDARADPRYIEFNEAIASEVAVPLIIEGKVIGVFNVESPRPRAFGERDVQVLAALSGYATIAIQNARLFEQTKRLAITDGLTELFNHRYLYEAMGRTLERCMHDGQPLALIMLEVDNFKRYNDTYGHRRGDEVLRIMADLLRKGSRTTDLVARYGGDEFMIVLPNSSKEAAHDIAERLRRMVEAYPFPLGEDIFISVTLSVGVAGAPEDGTTVDALVEAVDRAQYTAKKSGGNKVHVAQVLEDRVLRDADPAPPASRPQS